MRKPGSISFIEHVWPIDDNPLDMTLRLALADWLALHGHKGRADWIRRCCGDCQYVRDLRAGLTQIDCSTQYCYSSDPLGRIAQGFERVRPEWWPTPPQVTGYQNYHFGRIIMGGDPRWIYDGDWLEQAWREGWLEILQFDPHLEEQLDTIADVQEELQSVPLMLNTTRTHCSPPERQYRRILRFPGLHGLVLGPSELALDALNEFGAHARNLRYLQMKLQKRASSLHALAQLSQLTHLRSLVIEGAHPDDDSIRFVTSNGRLEFLALFGKNISDQGLERITEMLSLRYLAIDVPKVSRQAIERLQRSCPVLRVHIVGDMRDRIGPA